MELLVTILTACAGGRICLRLHDWPRGGAALWELGFVSVFAVGSFIVLDIVAARIITKTTKMDLITALFSCAPGGVSDMALIAEEMGSDSVTVAGMHTVRLVDVIALYPVLIKLPVSFIS